MQLSCQDGESNAAKQLRTILLEELELKFGSSPTFVSTLSAALDPRFRRLPHVDRAHKDAVTEEVLCLALQLSTGDVQSLDEPPKKIKQEDTKLA